MCVGYSFHRATTTAYHTIPTRKIFAPKYRTAAGGDKTATKLTSKTSNRAFTPQQWTANQIFWQLALIKGWLFFKKQPKLKRRCCYIGLLAPTDGGDGCTSLSSHALKKTYTHTTHHSLDFEDQNNTRESCEVPGSYLGYLGSLHSFSRWEYIREHDNNGRDTT